MQTANQHNLGPGFEQRRYQEIRRRTLASKLGRLGVSQAQAELDSGHERRWRHEVVSALSETMEGRVDTEYTFELKDRKLVAEDGEEIEELVERGFRQSMKMASEDVFYEFLTHRTRYELDEIREDQAMALGETAHNTTVKFSPYTEELDTNEENHSKLITANQKPYWQRGMFRLKHWDEQEKKLYMLTLSIDNSSVRFLHDIAEEVFDYRYSAINSTETLSETIRMNIPDNSWRKIPYRVIEAADAKLSRERGGEWHQGRCKENVKDTQKFVESQDAILEHLSHVDRDLISRYPSFNDYLTAFHNELYNQAALLDELRQRGIGVFVGDVESASTTAGYTAREEGKVFDACGLVLDGGNKLAKLASQTGLESLLLLAGRKLKCTNPDCRKEVVVPTEDLKDGKLTCNKCGLVYDVCSKESKFDKSKIIAGDKQLEKHAKKETQWQKIKREEREKKDGQIRQRQIDERAKKEEEMRLQLESGSRFTRAA